MNRLYIHIGLGKSGSTTLQEVYFRQHPGFINHGEAYGPLSRGFWSLYAYSGSGTPPTKAPGWESAAQSWASTAFSTQDAGSTEHSAILYSNENLSAWPKLATAIPTNFKWPMLDEPQGLPPRTGIPPVANFIAKLTGALSGLCTVHVVLVVRNQPEFLASLYAQLSPGRSGRGQQDFEDRIARLLTDCDLFLDWNLLATSLVESVGGSSDRVLVAFLEEGMPQVQQRIGDFLDPARDLSLKSLSAHRNRRQASLGRWKLGHRTSQTESISIPGEVRDAILQAYRDSNIELIRRWGTPYLEAFYGGH